MRRLFVLAVIALALASSASGSTPGPILGVSGNTARFHSQVGQTSLVDQAFLAWGQGQTWGAPFQVLFKSLGPIPMIHLGTNAKGSKTKQAITPAQIAAGAGDGYLSALNAAISQWGQGIYVRPLGEMNNRNVLWFTTPAIYTKAFTRIYEIVHGGSLASINAVLETLGMPPYKGSAEPNPFPRVRVLWSPLAGGADPTPYWPGNQSISYVDVGGADIYKEASGDPPWSKFTDIYNFVRAKHKPFAAPEWGMYGIDDPTFVQAMCDFLKQHPTETEEFYESRPNSIFDLGNKSKSRQVYERCITPMAGPPPSWAPAPATKKVLKITPSPASGTGPLNVTFTLQAQLSVPIVHWIVTFGDGGLQSGNGPPPATVTHTYADGASYQATLQVFASAPYTAGDTNFLAYTTVSVGDTPFIRFEPTPASGRAPLKVSFRIDASKLTQFINGWQIYFGDGLSNTGTGALPRFAGHTYMKAGKYNVMLVVIIRAQEYISVVPITVS